MRIFGERNIITPDVGVRGGQKLPKFPQLAWRSHLIKQVTSTRSTRSCSTVRPGVSPAQRRAAEAAITHPEVGMALLGMAFPGLRNSWSVCPSPACASGLMLKDPPDPSAPQPVWYHVGVDGGTYGTGAARACGEGSVASPAAAARSAPHLRKAPAAARGRAGGDGVRAPSQKEEHHNVWLNSDAARSQPFEGPKRPSSPGTATAAVPGWRFPVPSRPAARSVDSQSSYRPSSPPPTQARSRSLLSMLLLCKALYRQNRAVPGCSCSNCSSISSGATSPRQAEEIPRQAELE